MRFFGKQCRALMLSAVLVVGSVCVGCGGNKDGSAGAEKSGSGSSSKKSSELTDSRDGRKYRTVTIGNQTWMAENLRFETGDSWCYENDESKCRQYGRLYDWNTAKIACPKGWHLPTREEWTELVTVVGSETGGKKLKSTSGWDDNGNGTDEFGFSAPAGGGRYPRGSFAVGKGGFWWAATEVGSGGAYIRDMLSGHDGVNEGTNVKSDGFSVRCVADR